MGIASLKGKAIIIDCHALHSALCFPCTLLEMGSWQAKWNGSPGEIQPWKLKQNWTLDKEIAHQL